MTKKRKTLYNLILSAILLALALVLPFLTGQVPQIGKMLCPMHFPVIICGFFCGPLYAAVIGLIAPLFRFLLFGMPKLIPTGVAMCFELSAYGFISGLMYRILPKKKLYIYVSLVIAMISGRIVWGAVSAVIYGVTGTSFGMKAFVTGAIVNAVPGILLQLVLIPVVVMAIKGSVRVVIGDGSR